MNRPLATLIVALFALSACTPSPVRPTIDVAPPSDGEPRPTFTPLAATQAAAAGDVTPGVGTPSAPTPILTDEAGPSPEPFTPAAPDEARPTPTATGTPQTTVPFVYAFAVSPTEIELGGQVFLSWDAAGEGAAICPRSYLGLIDHLCFDVPLNGSQWVTINADDQTWDYTGFELRVRAEGREVTQFLPIRVVCQGEYEWWMYSSDPFATTLPPQCPTTRPIQSDGAYQRFERGLMLWVGDLNTLYALLNDGTYRALTPSAGTPSEVPPPGLQPPEGGFAGPWLQLRDEIGWATGPQAPTFTAHQCYAEAGQLTCFVRGPDSEIIRLNPGATWSIWPPGS